MKNKILPAVKRYFSITVKYIILFICLISFFVISLTLTSAYPESIQKYVKYRIEYSASRLYETEDDWYNFFTPEKSSKIDNYADSLMLHIIYCDDILPPVKSALAGALYGDTYAASQLKNLYATVAGEPAGDLVNYSRYWHGYRVWLKPLFIFFYYSQIRILNSYTFYILLMLCCLYLYKKINWQSALCLLIVMILLNITLIPMSLLFSCVFIISFAGTIAVLYAEQNHPKWMGMIFFALGALTMFFDFYSYPFYSMGIPLFSLMAYRAENGNKAKQMVKCSLFFLVSWLLGYLGTFLAKLLLTSIVIGKEELDMTIDIVKFRLESDAENTSFISVLINYFISGFKTTKAAFAELFVLPHKYIFGFFVIAWGLLFPFFKNDKNTIKLYTGYIIIFCFPFIWFSIVSKATIQHIYFQYRGIGLSVLIILYIFTHSINYEKLKMFISKLFQKSNIKID